MSPWTHAVGWTLIHFVWQGAVLAVIGAGALRLCRQRAAHVRYVIACFVLAAMLVWPAITALFLTTPDVTAVPAVGVPQTITAPVVASTGAHSWTDNGILSMYSVWSASIDALLPAIVFIWLAGVTTLLLRMAGGLWHVRRLQVLSLAMAPSRWQAAAERIASGLGLRMTVHVVESALVEIPAAVGWLRPVILLPFAALANLTASQVEAILAHELIHIRRHDYLVNVAQTVAETLLFFHPGVWWVSGQIRVEREHCCDDAAVQVCGDPVDYAEALAELEAFRSCGTTLALAASDGSLAGRVRRLLNLPMGHEARSLSWVVTLGLIFGSAVVTGGVYVSSSFGPGSAVALSRGAQVEPIASPDTFDWQVHGTNHFDIYYYQALTPNLEQIAVSAERAYERISSELQHNVPFKVPLIVFKTRSDFAQQTIIPEVGGGGAIARGEVTSFSEHRRNRVVILAEEEPERLYRQITHELTHIFAFDIIPRSTANIRRVPSFIDEGFAEYMTGAWNPDQLQQMRELVSTDRAPKMSALTRGMDGQSHVMAANLGHAVFEFIEAEYGKPGVWQFLLEVRRSVVDGADDPYQAAFNRTPEELDSAFANYFRRRFSP